jgi:LPS export ABC transporter protein LptC
MKATRKIVQVFMLGFLLILISVLAVGVWKGNTDKPQPAPTGELSDAEMSLTDMEYTEMQAGKRSWTLRATNARYFQNEQKSLLTAVRLTFFLDTGEEIQLESKEGILYAGTKNIELWGGVQAHFPRGFELNTERATYDHKEKIIHSDTVIEVAGPEVQVSGSRWKYRIPDRQAFLEGNVRASMAFFPPRTTASQ